MGGEGGTETGLEEAPGAGQGRAGTGPCRWKAYFHSQLSGEARSYTVSSEVSVAYCSYSKQWLFNENLLCVRDSARHL